MAEDVGAAVKFAAARWGAVAEGALAVAGVLLLAPPRLLVAEGDVTARQKGHHVNGAVRKSSSFILYVYFHSCHFFWHCNFFFKCNVFLIKIIFYNIFCGARRDHFYSYPWGKMISYKYFNKVKTPLYTF